MEMTPCPNCGTDNQANAFLCYRCGKSLHTAEAAASGTAATPSTAPKVAPVASPWLCSTCYGGRCRQRWSKIAVVLFALAGLQTLIAVLILASGERWAVGAGGSMLVGLVPLVAIALLAGRMMVCRDCSSSAVIPGSSPRAKVIAAEQQRAL